MAKLPAPANNHIKVYQMGIADNIVFTQTAAFTANLDEGTYYLHLSDGVNNFYSEVFKVVCYAPVTNKPLIITHPETKIEVLYEQDKIGTIYSQSRKPY